MKILIIIISDSITINPIPNILDKIINPLKKDNISVDIATCCSNGKINCISDSVKYNFECNGYQLTKTCFAVNQLDNEYYDFYIKTRPEVILKDEINKKFIDSLCKNSINSRCRSYKGPPINIINGFSCQKHDIRKDDLLLGDKVVVCPDDQFYIFHRNILDLFRPIYRDTYINYAENLIKNDKNYDWIDSWMLDVNYWNKSIIEKEGHHKFIWYYRGGSINIIGISLQMRTLMSSNLILN